LRSGSLTMHRDIRVTPKLNYDQGRRNPMLACNVCAPAVPKIRSIITPGKTKYDKQGLVGIQSEANDKQQIHKRIDHSHEIDIAKKQKLK
jgi:hypothetical protein